MRSVWKFPLSREYYCAGGYTFRMPRGAVVRLVADHGGDATLWAEVPDTNAPREGRRFSVVCTGDPVPEGAAHVGSYIEQGDFGHEFVYHVFEVI